MKWNFTMNGMKKIKKSFAHIFCLFHMISWGLITDRASAGTLPPLNFEITGTTETDMEYVFQLTTLATSPYVLRLDCQSFIQGLSIYSNLPTEDNKVAFVMMDENECVALLENSFSLEQKKSKGCFTVYANSLDQNFIPTGNTCAWPARN
jgi:hypothetical protein